MFSVSSTSLIIRHVSSVPALTLAFWRMLSAGGMLWVYSIKTQKKKITPKNRKRILLAGFFLGLHFAMFFVGVRNTSVASATLLANTGPIFTAIIAWINNTRFHKLVYYGLFLSVFGVVVIQGFDFIHESNSLIGNTLSLLSGFCLAITYVFASKIRTKTTALSYGRSVFIIAALTIGIIAIISGNSLFDFEITTIPWFLFLGLVPSILGHNMLNYCIKYLSPTAVASVPLGEPVIASIFGYFIFSEIVPIESVYGAPFVFFGIWLIINNSSKN